MAAVTEPAPSIWWLHPGALFAIVCGTVDLAAWLMPASVYETNWGSNKYFDDGAFLIGLAGIALFVFGVLVSRPLSSNAVDSPNWRTSINWERALTMFRVAAGLCGLGYAIWIGAAISRGANLALVVGVLTGEKDASYLMKDTYLITVGGLTTLTQFGIAAVILGCLLTSAGYWRSVRFPLVAVFALAVIRAVFNSERLAVIELIVPSVAVLLQLPALTLRLRREYPSLFYILPFFAAGFIFLIFTGSEYLRSWVNFYADRNASIWEFAATRLFGYYVTACNNSAYILRHPEVVGTAPYFTALFLWKFPGLNMAMRAMFPGIMVLDNRDQFADVLEAGTNPEFNNNGGLLLPVVDYDVTGGLLYWLIAGLLCGWAYRYYRRNSLGGLLFYPIFMLSILEVPRIIYWAEGRVFPAFVFLFIASRILSKPAQTETPCAA